MSDDLSPRELSAALRDLAGSGEAPAPTAGAQVRRRAAARRRRRHAAVWGGAAVAAGALVLGLTAGLGGGSGDGSGGRPVPPAAPSTRSAAPDATVDLAGRTLVVGDRRLPVSSGSARHPTEPGRMTVVAKHRTKRFTSESVGLGKEYDVTLPWVLELRGPDGATNYVVALTYAEQAPGRQDTTRGWIGLRPADAQWLYGHLDPGSVLSVEGRAPGTPAAPR
ncbi:L,D-transpeptidase [Streptomyces longispororuber]|uniref:L,D-transpeptidase n=1 Tax=Streptomyces longispororuber TaxID=68230 RepID=UPI00340E5804